MQPTLQHPYARSYQNTEAKTSVWKRFINWADKQEENRFGWVAFSISGHGCLFTILTAAAVLFTGNHFIFWPFIIGAMAIPLIANLAAMPTRITIPILFFSVLIDVAIIVLCLANGFDAGAAYR